MMDIDDTGDVYIPPAHPLDALHLEIIEHFTPLLVALVDRVAESDVPRTRAEASAPKSVHAPSWTRVRLAEWTVGICLDYLHERRPLPRSEPRLEVFLLKQGERGRFGSGRRGQDWPRAAWNGARGALEELGRRWEDRSIAESAEILKPFIESVFLRPLRPTGT